MDSDLVLAGSIVAAIIVILSVAIGVSLYNDSANYTRLKEQCMADGKKEYECVSMLNGNDKYVPMPVVVPMR